MVKKLHNYQEHLATLPAVSIFNDYFKYLRLLAILEVTI